MTEKYLEYFFPSTNEEVDISTMFSDEKITIELKLKELRAIYYYIYQDEMDRDEPDEWMGSILNTLGVVYQKALNDFKKQLEKYT